MSIGTGTVLFSLQNPKGTCAAFSQTWIALSLIGNRPLTNPGIVQKQALMNTVQTTAGGSSLTALTANGMSPGTPVSLPNATWHDAFKSLAQARPGYYYVTTKNPYHAMACYIQGGKIYYLEPEDSLSTFSDLGEFVSSASAWYANRTGSPTNQEFKYYSVTAGGAMATQQRPVIGRQRF